MRDIKCKEGEEFIELECVVDDIAFARIELSYEYGLSSFTIELPRTERNEHLKFGQKVWIAVGMERQVGTPKKSLREVYETLHGNEKRRIFALTPRVSHDRMIRMSTAYAIKNTNKVWREQ